METRYVLHYFNSVKDKFEKRVFDNLNEALDAAEPHKNSMYTMLKKESVAVENVDFKAELEARQA